MKQNKLSKKKNKQRPPRSTVELILIKHRNALGQTSPALEAVLNQLGNRPKHKSIRIKTIEGLVVAHHFYGGKLHLLWSPDVKLKSLIPHGIRLGFDWVFNWDFGYEIQSETLKINPKSSLRERSIDRSV